MIPQALKWVGAVVGLLILVVVAAPLALDAVFGTVEFEDDSGLFESSDEDDPFAELEADTEPDDGAEEEAGEDDEAAEGDDEPAEGEDADEDADDAEVVTDGDDAPGEDEDGEGDGSGETYVVEGGDTLYSIAEEVYGDGNRWSEIADANGIGDQTALTVGQELEIP